MADVDHAHQACRYSGCQFWRLSAMAADAATLLDGRNHMSQALWCDQGGHAFSERDPGRQRITVNVIDEDTEAETQLTKDLCGDCARTSGLTSKRITRPAIVTPPYQPPQYTAPGDMGGPRG
jgi:hypothetical protein